jgi:hypothetical protein
MNHFALIAALLLTAGLIQADTFELSDPAKELSEYQKAQEEQRVREEFEPMQEAPAPTGNTLCTIDTDNGACSCIDKVRARKLSLSQEECVARIMHSLKGQKE